MLEILSPLYSIVDDGRFSTCDRLQLLDDDGSVDVHRIELRIELHAGKGRYT